MGVIILKDPRTFKMEEPWPCLKVASYINHYKRIILTFEALL